MLHTSPTAGTYPTSYDGCLPGHDSGFDRRHTQTVIGDHFSDIDEDEQEDEATSQFLDVGVDDEAQPRTNGVSATRGMGDAGRLTM